MSSLIQLLLISKQWCLTIVYKNVSREARSECYRWLSFLDLFSVQLKHHSVSSRWAANQLYTSIHIHQIWEWRSIGNIRARPLKLWRWCCPALINWCYKMLHEAGVNKFSRRSYVQQFRTSSKSEVVNCWKYRDRENLLPAEWSILIYGLPCASSNFRFHWF